jgi:hypothetical protein
MGEAEGAVDEGHAVFAAQAEVGDHDVDGVIFQDADGTGDVGGYVDVEAIFKGGAEALTGVLFVVYD